MSGGKKSGPEMFSGLTDDESQVLKDKLHSGSLSAASRASSLDDGYDMAFEISGVFSDVHAASKKNK